MQRILCFKHHLRAEPVAGVGVFLVGERHRYMLKGALEALVAPLVDGRRTVQEIITALGPNASPPDVFSTLMKLEARGYLVEASPHLPAEAAAFWEATGIGAKHAMERLAQRPVTLRTVGGEDSQPFASAFTELGGRLEPRAEVMAVVARDYLEPELEDFNRQALQERFQLLLLKPTGTTPWVGPLLRPGEGPCWSCLAYRLRLNRPVEAFLAQRSGLVEPVLPPRAVLPGSTRAIAGLAAGVLARWLVSGAGAVDGHLLELHLADLKTTAHPVTRRPQCPACGEPGLLEARAREPLVLASRPKHFTEDGGYRCLTPEETLSRYERLVSPVTGVLGSLGPVPERNHPLRPVFAATYFAPPMNATPDHGDFTRVSLGKGRTAAQARASALCEAIERLSAIVRGDEPRVRARLSELGGEAMEPQVLQNFSEAQYLGREAANARIDDPRRRIPLPFDERVAIDWTPAWSLTHERRRYLPFAWCWMEPGTPPAERFFHLDPNGHAAGNCLEEAILQGFLELAERDAIGIWWYNRVRRPQVELSSFGEPYFVTLVDHYWSMGWKLWVLDITTDLGIPAFVALAREEGTGRFCVGFGCHLEARLGVQRALTELNQIFDPSGRAPAPWDEAGVTDLSYLLPDETQRPRRRGDYPEVASGDLRDDIRDCAGRAARLGLETLVVDQTRPDIGLHAVKVAVPGLRHIWPRLGPGRLYEVPVRMGWLDVPGLESGLNPVHLFL
jgi:bacteriocin biosynthesis cyclodehydratase domain-containing protein